MYYDDIQPQLFQDHIPPIIFLHVFLEDTILGKYPGSLVLLIFSLPLQ